MQLHLFQSTPLCFAIITIILVHLPWFFYADDAQFLACSKSFQCGNISEIGYPFWGQDRQEACGYPGFQLICEGEAASITIAGQSFRVLQIDNRTKTLTVARSDYVNNICPTNLYNTSINSTIFSYASNVQNVILFYDCPPFTPPPGVTIPNSSFSCSNMAAYYFTRDPSQIPGIGAAANSLGTCKNRVEVPVFRSAVAALEAANTNTTTLVQGIDGGFGLEWIANNSVCDECMGSGGQCGHILSSGEFACYCTNGSFVSTCGSAPSPLPASGSGSFFKRNKWIKIAIGVVAGVVGIIVVLIIVICSLRKEYLSGKAMTFWKKETKADQKLEEFVKNHESLAPKRYRYSEVKIITNSFVDELGKGGFGIVYKGKLSDGRLVAVKILNQSKGNGEDFINEVASISRTSHVNVVSLLGFCYEKTKKALIYEFMSNGSLDKFIYHQGSSNTNRYLEWNTLRQIAIGIGRGLEYLHRGCNTRILHFDIKPHNILLDENFCPKISDFGLALLCRNGESTVSMQNGRGTFGYAAPELFRRTFGKVSYKSDVYSYGMMLLEMVGGRRNFDVGVSQSSEIYFPHWIHNHLEQGQDLRLGGVVTEEEEELARKMMLVSLQCIQTIPSDRPTMTEVIEKLEGSLQSLEIPPKPFPSSPARPLQHSSTTATTTTSSSTTATTTTSSSLSSSQKLCDKEEDNKRMLLGLEEKE